jgi:hypothetical protein
MTIHTLLRGEFSDTARMTIHGNDAERAAREPEIIRLFAEARAKLPAATHIDLIDEIHSRLPRTASISEVKRIAMMFRLPVF